MSEENKVRLDKWLWAARFYKTRSLASDAIRGGKVHVNDSRVKPSKIIFIGQSVRIKKDSLEMTVIIDALSEKRGSATIAQTLYTETEASIEKRAVMSSQRKALMAHTAPLKRPTKKQRRQIVQFKQAYNQ